LQLAEIGALLIPDDQVAAPVERLGGARDDVGHQAEPLRPGPAGKLDEIAHVGVLVKVVEIRFPARQRIGHHHVHIAALTCGCLARPRLADRPLRRRGGRKRQRHAEADRESLENIVHVDLMSVGHQDRP
jgi:hypothetical protein